MNEGLGWVLAANLVLWTGLFLYLLRLERLVSKGAAREKQS
jgi:CcmD family protein